MEAFRKLPLTLQKSLNRWYIASAVLLLVTVCAITTLHIYTTLTLHKASKSIPPLQNTLDTEEPILQKRIADILTWRRTQQAFLPLLVACLEALPAAITLQSFCLTEKEIFTCTGKAINATAISTYMNALHAQGLTCTNVATTATPDDTFPLQFQMEAKKCTSYTNS
jgi:hypothetical protein